MQSHVGVHLGTRIINDFHFHMRPIFTVHAGEYLVGSEIEGLSSGYKVWVPSKDSGIDLLVTTESCEKVASIQVKFSKDHLASGKELRANGKIKSGGWWTLDRRKLSESPADFWVLVLGQLNARKYDFVVIRPKDLSRRYEKISPGKNIIQSYFWITSENKCWETRGLGSDDLGKICDGTFKNASRDFTSYLNHWSFNK